MHYLNNSIGAAVCAAAACLPSISAALSIPLSSPVAPQPQRNAAKIVPRFRARPTNAPTVLVPLPHEHHTHLLHEHMTYDPAVGFMAADVARDSAAPAMSNVGGPASTLVNRILQVALGLFVTTMELPPLPPESLNRHDLGYDCDFSTACRWSSVGATPERWRLARGEPDVLLWLAATGTMVLPSEPFTLIEIRGGTPVDMLSSDVIPCQRESALFGFTYWTVGLSDLEICLLDLHYRQFNCTGMLQSHIQPGKVALEIPPVKHPFRIAIIPSVDQGILILDDIKYDGKYCGKIPTVIEPLPTVTSAPESVDPTTRWTATLGLMGPTSFPFIPNPTTTTAFPTLPTLPTLSQITFTSVLPPFIASLSTPAPDTVTSTRMVPLPNIFSPPLPAPLTMPPPPVPVVLPIAFNSTIFPLTAPTASTVFPYITPKPILIVPEPMRPFVTRSTTTTKPSIESTSSEGAGAPFDLLIYGNRTLPLFDRRSGEMIKDSADLLCDFGNNFPCLWGPSAGKWAIIEKGAIPSLEFGPSSKTQLPAYPAVVVIQGAAMLTSDPIRCQSGEGKLLFRYWTNGRVLMQVCAKGYGLDSEKIQCVEELAKSNEPLGDGGYSMDSSTLAVFTLSNVIREPFTLNIIPIFERNSRNNFLVLDEIVYIGECNLTMLAEHEQKMLRLGGIFGGGSNGGGMETRNLATPKSSGTDGSDWSRIDAEDRGDNKDLSSGGESIENETAATAKPKIKIVSLPSSTSWPRKSNLPSQLLSKTNAPVILPMFPGVTRLISKGTRYPFAPTTPFIVSTTISTLRGPNPVDGRPTTIVFPEQGDKRWPDSTRGSFTISPPSTPNTVITEEPPIDYCKLLNCDFNENACNYLNHGMTKIPWTLKNKGYGFPLLKNTDLRPNAANGQFVSALLGSGDFAILESPHFNITQGINVLLFQYYRPTHLSAIRLCLETRHTKPYRTIASFLQCPPILRSVTSKNALKWNSVHIQLPPGTSHFYLIAHNLERSAEKAAVAIDNIRVAICDPRNYAPPRESELEALENVLNGSNDDEIEDETKPADDEPPLYANDGKE